MLVNVTRYRHGHVQETGHLLWPRTLKPTLEKRNGCRDPAGSVLSSLVFLRANENALAAPLVQIWLFALMRASSEIL